ncbi:MAG TPA: universal stress protein [Solirubrobacteraceae bacterium]|jgi:nucleotide-binding universal stress UspA family protein|nr:universal stress protein [Solirubrobacteraceae bacterium]
MFKNVLVGVDGSPRGRDAIALASRLIPPDGKITLAHVRNAELNPFDAITPGLVQEEREASEKLLAKEAGNAVGAELVSVVAGDAGRGLHLRAEEQHADLLVVGSSGRGMLGRAMLGDDTRAALNGAPCAVAIAAVGYSEHASPIAKVGVAYNESPESKEALAAARELAAATRATVHPLEVVSIPTYAFIGMSPPLLGETVDTMLQEASARMAQLPGVEVRAVYGLVGEELAQFGDAVDILVVGSRSYGPLRRLVLGSTSNYLERHARCSLLVLPRGAAAGGEPVSTTEIQAENVIA